MSKEHTRIILAISCMVESSRDRMRLDISVSDVELVLEHFAVVLELVVLDEHDLRWIHPADELSHRFLGAAQIPFPEKLDAGPVRHAVQDVDCLQADGFTDGQLQQHRMDYS